MISKSLSFLSLLCFFCLVQLSASAPDFESKYKKPVIDFRHYASGLAMMGPERDEYATNLASIVVKTIRDAKGDQDSLDFGSKVLGLALHLSPRNKKALIANAQLSSGVLPKPIPADYDLEVFSKLLINRSKILEQSEGEKNKEVAGYFIALAALLDPRNEDAVYAAEIRKIDHGEANWKVVTGEIKKP